MRKNWWSSAVLTSSYASGQTDRRTYSSQYFAHPSLRLCKMPLVSGLLFLTDTNGVTSHFRVVDGKPAVPTFENDLDGVKVPSHRIRHGVAPYGTVRAALRRRFHSGCMPHCAVPNPMWKKVKLSNLSIVTVTSRRCRLATAFKIARRMLCVPHCVKTRRYPQNRVAIASQKNRRYAPTTSMWIKFCGQKLVPKKRVPKMACFLSNAEWDSRLNPQPNQSICVLFWLPQFPVNVY